MAAHWSGILLFPHFIPSSVVAHWSGILLFPRSIPSSAAAHWSGVLLFPRLITTSNPSNFVVVIRHSSELFAAHNYSLSGSKFSARYKILMNRKKKCRTTNTRLEADLNQELNMGTEVYQISEKYTRSVRNITDQWAATELGGWGESMKFGENYNMATQIVIWSIENEYILASSSLVSILGSGGKHEQALQLQ